MAIASVPWEGFGNAFNNTGIWPDALYYLQVAPGARQIGAPPVVTTDRTFTYQRRTMRIALSGSGIYAPYDGLWQQLVEEYHTYWINGYGVTTYIATVTDSSPTIQSLFGTSPPGPFTFAMTGVTATATLTESTGVDIFSSGNFHMTLTATLENRVNYSDQVDLSINALDSVGYTPFPTTPPAGPSYAPNYRADLVYPSSGPSTYATVANWTGPQYQLFAARGVLKGSLSISQNTGMDFSSAVPAIISAKSQWLVSGLATGIYGAITDIYWYPIDPSDFTYKAVEHLSAALSVVGVAVKFSPSVITQSGHTGSDIPTYPYGGSYTPPYNPGGYGELSFKNTPA